MGSVASERIKALNAEPVGSGAVLYWMQRDQRVQDNWALLYADERARERKVPLVVTFNMVPSFGVAPLRAYDFMVRGLQEVENELTRLNIPFIVPTGQPEYTIPALVKKYGVGEVVTDFNPMRTPRGWHEDVAKKIKVSLTVVDAHNIVPCFIASDKQEFAAYTLRPKIHRQLKNFLVPFPKLKSNSINQFEFKPINWDKIVKTLKIDENVAPVEWLIPGEKAARKVMQHFIDNKLPKYHERRNDPNEDGQSNLSPYLHFGQISAQRVALEVSSEFGVPKDAKEAFLEELIVRRELADNFCYYNSKYDSVEGAHAWAQTTLSEYKNDVREYLYSKEAFESGDTHDELWNAMQMQMVREGKMHGWCRMYWAKKIFEWTKDAQEAIDIALYLNDKYELDGRDPNGVVGVMWSICGVHDRAWNPRPIFGKIRYMNFNGAKRKFDVKAYVQKYSKSEKLF